MCSAVLVHAERRGERAAPDERDTGELKKPLHRAVLAILPMQHGEGEIDSPQHPLAIVEFPKPRRTAARREGGGAEERGIVHPRSGGDGAVGAEIVMPVSVFRDADGQRIKPLCVNGLQHRRGGLERNFVFARMAAEEHGERFLFGVHGLFIPFVWACPPAEGRRSRIRSCTKAAAPLFWSRRRSPRGIPRRARRFFRRGLYT